MSSTLLEVLSDSSCNSSNATKTNDSDCPCLSTKGNSNEASLQPDQMPPEASIHQSSSRLLQIPQISQQRPSFLINDILREDKRDEVKPNCSESSSAVSAHYESDSNCSADDEIQKRFDRSRGMCIKIRISVCEDIYIMCHSRIEEN